MLLDKRALISFIICTVVVPSTVSTVVVVFQNHCVDGVATTLALGDISYSVIFFRDSLFHDKIMLSLNIVFFVVKVQFIIGGIF